MIKKANHFPKDAHRVVTFLTREEVDFLDKIGKDALFSTGAKLSRSKIISAIVNVLRKLNIDGRGLHSKKELEHKLAQMTRDLSHNENKRGAKNEEQI